MEKDGTEECGPAGPQGHGGSVLVARAGQRGQKFV